MTTDTDWLMALADEIGSRIDAGNLPPKDAAGRYQMEFAAADVAATVAKGGIA